MKRFFIYLLLLLVSLPAISQVAYREYNQQMERWEEQEY